MITEKDLKEAIAECQGVRSPNANVCIKLASYYTILDHINNVEKLDTSLYSLSGSDNTNSIKYVSNTEFAQAIHGRESDKVFGLIDELMTTLQVLNPKLYDSVMQRIQIGGS